MPEQPRLHTGLTVERWWALTVHEQMGNIGSEVGRAIRAKDKGKTERMWGAIERALELFSVTVADAKHRGHLKEITRAREVVLDYLVGDNDYRSTGEDLERYFTLFALAARRASAAAGFMARSIP
jgi:hypothetical protein